MERQYELSHCGIRGSKAAEANHDNSVGSHQNCWPATVLWRTNQQHANTMDTRLGLLLNSLRAAGGCNLMWAGCTHKHWCMKQNRLILFRTYDQIHNHARTIPPVNHQ